MIFKSYKIRRGIDCACDYEYICHYHLRKVVWRGAIAGLVICGIVIYLVYLASI